jgi:hypothetical protein
MMYVQKGHLSNRSPERLIHQTSNQTRSDQNIVQEIRSHHHAYSIPCGLCGDNTTCQNNLATTMKRYPLKLLTLALAVDSATSFLSNRPANSIVRANVDSVFTHFAASDVQIGASGDSTFPYGNDAVRFAYDEWRLKFAKGAFDPVRFESFQTNFKALTTANLEARNKAFADGSGPPTWMSLNEYGDYSMADYEAMNRGEPIPAPPVQPTPQLNLAPKVSVEQNQAHQSQPPAANYQAQPSATHIEGDNMQENGLNDEVRNSHHIDGLKRFFSLTVKFACEGP